MRERVAGAPHAVRTLALVSTSQGTSFVCATCDKAAYFDRSTGEDRRQGWVHYDRRRWQGHRADAVVR